MFAEKLSGLVNSFRNNGSIKRSKATLAFAVFGYPENVDNFFGFTSQFCISEDSACLRK